MIVLRDLLNGSVLGVLELESQIPVGKRSVAALVKLVDLPREYDAAVGVRDLGFDL